MKAKGAPGTAAGVGLFALAALTIVLLGALAVAACGGASSSSAQPAAGGVGSASPPTSASPPGPVSPARQKELARARSAMDAFVRAFYERTGNRAQWALSTAGGQTSYYRQAEMIEMVEDAYQSTHDPAYKQMIVLLMKGLTYNFSHDWLGRTYNDDIMWAIIASLRAYEITGDRRYLVMAQRNFDGVYARAWDPVLGGGLWWTTARTEKNVTTSAPAAIAAAKLAADLHDPSYLLKARRLYAWVRTHLYDPRTGAVWDAMWRQGSKVVYRKVALTYNQGSFIGAAELLYQATGRRQYFNDALRTLKFARAHVVVGNGILPSEAGGPDSNGGGFKGIFARWAVLFARANQLSAFNAWFQKNAGAAWSHRDARGLMGTEWWLPTTQGTIYAWDASSAVVLLQVLAGQ